MKKKAIVVGAGITGLVQAYYLVQSGRTVEVHEQKEDVGGLIATKKTDLGLVETAANAVILSETLHHLLTDIGLHYDPMMETAKKRYIFRGRPRRWPLGILGTLQIIRRVFFVMLKGWGSLTAHPNESVLEWTKRLFSPEINDYLIQPGLQGIYAANTDDLSASLILNPLWERFKKAKKSKYRGSVAPAGGMGQLIQHLHTYLMNKGVEFHFASSGPTKDLSQQEWFLCMGVAGTGTWLESNDNELFQNWQKLTPVPLVTTTMFFKQAPEKINGLGCLFPPKENFNSVGVLFNTSIFPGRSELHSETWIAGSFLNAALMDCTDDELKEKLLQDRQRLQACAQEPEDIHISRWPQALVRYDLDLENFLQNFDAREGIHLCGSFMGGIGISKIVDRAQALAFGN